MLIARWLEHRAKERGPLFAQPPTRRTRIIAIAVALLFSDAFITEAFLVGSYHVVFSIIALGLSAYALGANWLIKGIQHETDRSAHDSKLE